MSAKKPLLTNEYYEEFLFISYSPTILDKAAEVIQFLQRNGYSLWFHMGESPGEIDDDVKHHIEWCSAVICLLSEDYFENIYCREEYLYAKKIYKETVPVLMGNIEDASKVKVPNSIQIDVNIIWNGLDTLMPNFFLAILGKNERVSACRCNYSAIGNIYSFGRYPYSNKGSIEEIEWIVIDEIGDSLLLLSKEGLDYKPYNDNAKPTNWEACSLRKWLNTEFAFMAFNKEEYDIILPTMIQPERENYLFSDTTADIGKETTDKVFILDYLELLDYFPRAFERLCKATRYAQRLYNNDKNSKRHMKLNEDCCWWLRSYGLIGTGISPDRYDMLGFFNTFDNLYVRPAIWIHKVDY